MKAKYLLLVGVILICCIVLLSCAGKKNMQPVAPKDPAVLYTEGMVLFNKGKYKDAIEVFTRLKDYFPSDELYAPKADLRIADSNCFRKEYPEAITRYLEFKKQYKSKLIQFFKEILTLNLSQVGVFPTHLTSYYYNNRLYLVDRDRHRGSALFLFQHFSQLIDFLVSPQVKFVLINEWEKLHNLTKDLEGCLRKVW